jgi:hypothetical protein
MGFEESGAVRLIIVGIVLIYLDHDLFNKGSVLSNTLDPLITYLTLKNAFGTSKASL